MESNINDQMDIDINMLHCNIKPVMVSIMCESVGALIW